MKKLSITLFAAAAALLLVPSQVPAALLITISQVGSNMVVNGSGSLTITGLSLLSTNATTGGITPSSGSIRLGSNGRSGFSLYTASFTGSASFGTGGSTVPTSGINVVFGLNANSGTLSVPENYVSGASLASTSTYANASFTSLGITPGNYTYSYSATSGGTILDTITVQAAVPELSTSALFGLGALGAGVVALHRRRLPA